MARKGKGLAAETRANDLEFDPWNPPKGGRRDSALRSCPVASTHGLWYKHTYVVHTQVHTL